MASPGQGELQEVVERYGVVADAVNRREMERFINEVRSKWNPEPEFKREEPCLAGYTDAGALNLHIYQLAFDDPDPPRETSLPLCKAEQYNQVLLQPPVESLIDFIPKPLADPVPSDQIKAKLDSLKAALREQSEASGGTLPADFELPEDFKTLMTLTNGIMGAGVPRETARLALIFRLEVQRVEPGIMEDISYWVRSRAKAVPLVAWKIGDCIQYRNIYYMLCRSLDDGDESSLSWKIFELRHIELDIYDDLAHLIRHEIEYIEKTPGGAQTVDVLRFDSYPIW